MNAPLLPQVLYRRADEPQSELPLATGGVRCHVWESRFGRMLIEVRDGRIYVNGGLVEPAEPAPERRQPGDTA